ncbi:hypothetical protein M3P21_21015 [Ruegeria sp. 2012CJ41-6]|uniref:Uncharacterized protein n=1 Tax=Ruegeria spongiae TaxID=2942209 RepID=A0ABT0Q7Z3_9RHOB|nr:hypothetical protein [Ruegeria spongiae]MCL6286000.1 hypothetical protein [Ruegeria spongiae]
MPTIRKTERSWKPAREHFGSGDPLRGQRRMLRAELANETRARLLEAIPLNEMVEALGGSAKDRSEVIAEGGKFRVVRIRTDLAAFCAALQERHKFNEGRGIGAAAVMSTLILRGIEGTLGLPEFRPIPKSAHPRTERRYE